MIEEEVRIVELPIVDAIAMMMRKSVAGKSRWREMKKYRDDDRFEVQKTDLISSKKKAHILPGIVEDDRES